MAVPELKISRGDLWYITSDPLEERSVNLGRWVIVLTSEVGCDTANDITCVPLTTQLNGQHRSVNTLIKSGDRPRVAKGNKVTTFPKEIFRYKCGRVTDEELEQVETTVLLSMGIIKFGETATDFRAPKVDDKDELRLECDLYKRLYEKTLERLVELKLEKDSAPPLGLEPVVEETAFQEWEWPTEEPESVVKPFYVNPDEEEPLPDLTKPDPKVKKKKKKKKNDDAPKMININEATWGDLREKLGFGEATAKRIIAARKRNNGFTCIEEVACLPGMGRNNIKKIEGRLIFGNDERE